MRSGSESLIKITKSKVTKNDMKSKRRIETACINKKLKYILTRIV